MIHDSTSWSFWDRWCDAEGQVLSVKGTICCSMVTLVNLYLPNSNQITFLEQFFAKLGKLAEGMLIVRGDMNFIMDPILDASTHASHFSYTVLKHLKKNFHAFQLVDILSPQFIYKNRYLYGHSISPVQVQICFHRLDYFLRPRSSYG